MVRKNIFKVWLPVVMLVVLLLGLLSIFDVPEHAKNFISNKDPRSIELEMVSLSVFPEGGYLIPVDFADLGPKLIKSGVIDRTKFIKVFKNAGRPLNDEQLKILDGHYSGQITINEQNSYFLLNFLWAVGLANKNPILNSGAMHSFSNGNIESFASTGGWKLTSCPIKEVFSNHQLIQMNAEQQKSVESAAARIFRPCCNNPVSFPDCNHGMAMLGLLELMGSQNKTEKEMLEAAKYMNAYWFRNQTLAQAIYFKNAEKKDFGDVDAERNLSSLFSSSAGFYELHNYLVEKDWIPTSSGNLINCGV